MNMKKLFLLNLPYLLFVYPFDKLAQAFRLAPGADLSGKLLSIGDGFTAAFSFPWLSFQPTDLLIGIAGAVILPHLFEAFYRADTSRNRNTGGTGLGLYIVRKIMELHHAKYGIQNTSRGVVFWLEMPQERGAINSI